MPLAEEEAVLESDVNGRMAVSCELEICWALQCLGRGTDARPAEEQTGRRFADGRRARDDASNAVTDGYINLACKSTVFFWWQDGDCPKYGRISLTVQCRKSPARPSSSSDLALLCVQNLHNKLIVRQPFLCSRERHDTMKLPLNSTKPSRGGINEPNARSYIGAHHDLGPQLRTTLTASEQETLSNTDAESNTLPAGKSLKDRQLTWHRCLHRK